MLTIGGNESDYRKLHWFRKTSCSKDGVEPAPQSQSFGPRARSYSISIQPVLEYFTIPFFWVIEILRPDHIHPTSHQTRQILTGHLALSTSMQLLKWAIPEDKDTPLLRK